MNADRIEDRVHAAASASGVPFEVVGCDPARADTTEFCATYGYALEDAANCVVVVGKSDPPVFAACVVLATTRLDVNGVVRRRLGTRKASFASPGDVETLTDMAIGGVTPLALPPGLPLWVDERVMERERIVLGGGSRSCKLVAAPILLTAVGAEPVRDLAK
ncbi:MAG TPA: YbaK/EbsC family protein [Acidimicrobiia bacterium]|nr:YbaK/EbsC family protein [Acidimicrobiia bacterium]